jgi:glycerophosphoryl diester phosphodiesterase
MYSYAKISVSILLREDDCLNKKKKNVIRQAFHLINFNIKAIAGFEIIYKLISWAICAPLLVKLFRLSLHFAGIQYISSSNLKTYLLFPSTVIVLFLFVLLGASFMVLELFGLVYAMHASHDSVRIKSREIWLHGISTVVRLKDRRNMKSVFYFILIAAVLGLFYSPSFFPELKVPDFIEEYIAGNIILSILCIAGVIGLAIAAVRWMYVIHCFVLTGDDISEAAKDSVKMVHKNMFHILLYMFVWTVIVIGMLALFTAGMFFCMNAFNSSSAWISVCSIIGLVICFAGEIAVSMMIVPLEFALISALFYKKDEELGKTLPSYEAPQTGMHGKSRKICAVIMAGMCAFSLCYAGNYISHIDVSSGLRAMNVKITAHRGDTSEALENTLPAFQSAIDNHYDYIELDTQPDKDGTPVVIHDTNLSRLCGVNKNIGDVTDNELQNMPLLHGDGVTVPKLKDAILLCRDKIMMNVELKNSDKRFIKKTVRMLEKYDMQDKCVVASLDYNALKTVKEYAPDLKTCYITSIAYGDIGEMKDADVFSIEASFATQTIVDSIHNEGKQVFVWTVNNEDDIERVMDLGVDSIITDKGSEAMETRREAFNDSDE